VCASLALVVCLGASTVLYRGASRSLRNEVREHLKAVAATAAVQVDPDQHRLVRSKADESTKTYRCLKSVLADVRRANPGIRYVYTMRKTRNPNALVFVIDAEKDPELMSHVGDEYDIGEYPQMRLAFERPAADEEPSDDEWGTWLSGYAPITDSRGRTEAIVGLDMSLGQLRREESALRKAASQNAVVALLLSVALSLVVTKALLKTVRVFTRAAERIRGGDLDVWVPTRGSDEIAKFAEAFNHMAQGLRQTTRDVLTGVYNHVYFHERLADETERAERHQHTLCLLILDLDRFKSINDTLGHPVGDCVLKQLAELIVENTRRIDIVARYGGDEFVVILPETDLADALIVAEGLREKVEQHAFDGVTIADTLADHYTPDSDRVVRLSLTIGAAAYPEHHATKDGLVMAADIALCRAKQVARNSVQAYDAAFAGAGGVDPHSLYRALQDPNATAIESLAAAVDAKDRYTHGHSERVSEYALAIAQALGYDESFAAALRVAALLHDLGKIGVPDSILTKNGTLTSEEREAVRKHPSIGENILRRAPQLDLIVPAVLFHHERWDGAGYPDGLSRESIPLMARMLAVADAFDAMTSDRPYRCAMTVDVALIELQANAGKQFDPRLVEAFISSYRHVAQGEAA